jgi:hypothetical protein
MKPAATLLLLALAVAIAGCDQREEEPVRPVPPPRADALAADVPASILLAAARRDWQHAPSPPYSGR